jgi:hypothetical protein
MNAEHGLLIALRPLNVPAVLLNCLKPKTIQRCRRQQFNNAQSRIALLALVANHKLFRKIFSANDSGHFTTSGGC